MFDLYFYSPINPNSVGAGMVTKFVENKGSAVPGASPENGGARAPIAIGAASRHFEGKGQGFAKKPAPDVFSRLPALPGSFGDSYPGQEQKRQFRMGDPHPLFPHLRRIDCEYY